jgi:hypothetical protein
MATVDERIVANKWFFAGLDQILQRLDIRVSQDLGIDEKDGC